MKTHNDKRVISLFSAKTICKISKWQQQKMAQNDTLFFLLQFFRTRKPFSFAKAAPSIKIEKDFFLLRGRVIDEISVTSIMIVSSRPDSVTKKYVIKNTTLLLLL